MIPGEIFLGILCVVCINSDTEVNIGGVKMISTPPFFKKKGLFSSELLHVNVIFHPFDTISGAFIWILCAVSIKSNTVMNKFSSNDKFQQLALFGAVGKFVICDTPVITGA